MNIMKQYERNHFRVGAVLAAGILIMLSACATVPREIFTANPASYFKEKPQAFIQLSRTAMQELILSMDQETLDGFARSFSQTQDKADKDETASVDKNMLRSFLSRTSRLGIGIAGYDTVQPRMEAVLLGDFPIYSVRLAMLSNTEWRKVDNYQYRSTRYPLYIQVVDNGIVRFTTYSNSKTANSTAFTIIPPRFAESYNADISFYISEPKAFLSKIIPMEAAALPIDSIVITGRKPEAPWSSSSEPLEDPEYDLDFAIIMKDEATARMYRPIARFFWLAMVDKLLGPDSSAKTSSLNLENDVYSIKGIKISSNDIRALLLDSIIGRNE